jgi:prepilin-type N-terminal cleavage/methylation domain-containing protein
MLCGMKNASRRAFSLVEVVVAVVIMGIGVASLASALTADLRLRSRAVGRVLAAERLRARIELLARKRCTADTGGRTTESWGADAWRATVDSASWRLTDSLILRRAARPLVVEARIACPE